MLIWPFPDQCLETSVGLDIPEFDGSVVTACGKGMAPRSESYPPYPVSVSPHGTEAVAGVDIPEAGGLIFAATGKQVPVRTKSNRPDPTGMTL